MIVTHNYYVDFLKSFNIFLKKVFNPLLSKTGQDIQKIEYNIGSNTLLKYNLYGNESYEYPNIIIDLTDVRGDEGVSGIKNNIYGLINNINTVYLCDNMTKNEYIKCDLKKYILNFNIQINVETAADLLNYYHLVVNRIPINFTFVDYSFFYSVEVTEFVKNWDFINDDIYNIFLFPDPTERDKNQYFSYIEIQPEFEFTSITKSEDKENMKYSINLNVLASVLLPSFLYGNAFQYFDRVIFDISTTDDIQWPILIDTNNIFESNKIKKGINIQKENFILKNNNIEIDLSSYNIILNQNDVYLLSLIENIIDPLSSKLDIPIDQNFSIENNKIIIKGNKAELIKDFLTSKQYIENLTQYQLYFLN